MKIKILELNNFKSFKGKITISFKSGLTLITGLNGTGKSNIIDGINFALGKYEAKTEYLIHEGETEASVRIVLTDENGNLISIFKTIDINGKKSLYINGKSANDNDIPYDDFDFLLLDSDAHNQLDSKKMKDLIAELKEKSNRQQIILVSTGNDLTDYANQIIAVNQKIKNQSEIKETQLI